MGTILNKNAQGYGYKYTDLAEIHNYLESIGSRYIQKIERIEGDDYVFTKRCFDGKWEDDWIQGSRVVQATLSGIKNPAQENGSALTYARRYSVLLAYGLCTDDDDAQSLTTKKTYTKEDAENYTLDFGKNAGKKLTELNSSYLHWLYDNNEQCRQMIDILGLLPSEESIEQSIDIIQDIMKLIDETGIDLDKIKDTYKINSLNDATNEQLDEIKNTLLKHKEAKQ